MRLDLRQKRFVVSGLLFGLVCILQTLALSLSPVEVFGKYVGAAKDYLNGKLDPSRITDFSPFYFDLHVVLAKNFDGYFNLLRSVQILAAACCVVLVYLIFARYFRNGIALLGAVFLSFSFGVVVLTPVMVPEIWVLLFGTAAVYFLVLFIKKEAGLWSLILCGAASGFSMLTRPTFLLLIPFLLLSIFLQRNKNSKSALLIYGGCLLFFVAALLVRNHAYTQRTTWMVMDPGGVFFEGNNPYSFGGGVHTPLIKDLEGQQFTEPSYAQHLLKEFPSAVAGRPLNSEESNAYWRNKALQYIRENPGAYLRLIGTKAHCLFRTPELHDVRAVVIHEQELKARHFPIFPFAILTSFAIVGLVVQRKNWKTLCLFYGGFLVYSITPLIYFVSSRYRFSLLPFILFFACAGLEWVWQACLQRKYTGLTLASLFVLLFTWLLNAPGPFDSLSYTWRSILEAHKFQAAAADLRNQNQRPKAAEKVAQSLATAPFLSETLVLANLPYGKNEPWQKAIQYKMELCESDPNPDSCLFDLGLLLLQNGRYPEAKALMEALAGQGAIFPRWYLGSPDPNYYLARVAAEFENNPSKATDYLEKALSRNPGDYECLAAMTVVLEWSGKQEQADIYKGKLFRYVDEIDANYFLGKAYFHKKEYEKSARHFQQVLQWLPAERKVALYAAAALAGSERFPESIRIYQKVMNQKQDPLLLQPEILDAFREQTDVLRNSAEAYSSFGIALRQFGDFEESRIMQENALFIDPDYEPARRELKLLKLVQ